MADDPRRRILGVDRLVELPWYRALAEQHGGAWVRDQIREVLSALRSGAEPIPDSEDGYESLLRARIALGVAPSLVPVINATGVVLHTNLGRAPLANAARSAMAAAAGYSNLEFDLDTGKRGSRYDHCVELLCELTGAEGALVVNNCAAAVALALAAFAGGRSVLVSHGELVEIGGGFRIPEVVEASGARLVAVGTTNRTRVEDYRRALDGESVGAILKVHRSNFEVRGFTEDADLAALVELGRKRQVGVIHDLGSGLLLAPDMLGLPSEPTPQDSVRAGAELVAFSGDKLLGGPQAGVLVGTEEAIRRARRHPLCRAVRTDKVTLAGLEATLTLYRDPARAVAEVPALRMLSESAAAVESRARELVGRLSDAPGASALRVAEGESLVGGGTFPGVRLKSWTVSWTPRGTPDRILANLRKGDPPVVARVNEGSVVVDVRTVGQEQVEDLAGAIRRALSADGA
ncbi:MAG: L-seryl-tRNA(Sec) selenium transferase [Longimicrobiales bacterium]